MASKEKKYNVTDVAWEHLHTRLERNGLLPERSVSKPRSAARTAAAAVATLLLIGAATALYGLHQAMNRKKEAQLVIRNEANTSTLATMLHDGSVVYLSEQASLEYPDSFDGNNRREVFLRGEAFFDVGKNTAQPFFVHTDQATVEVTGTSFDVKSHARSSFRLSVRSGTVRVSLKNHPQSLSAQTGETVSFNSGKLQLSKTPPEIGFEAYFRHIHFKDERLDHIAHIINRTADTVKIKIASEVQDRRVTFTLSGHRDIEAVCLALNLHYHIQGHTIYISSNTGED